ncbi:D-mannose binding lectin [Paenibacillus cellulosilyticus]|uniref:D-mannose binding lectin n=1 Tax=Paenibacillus cellulosilyticus TaxID=375489 RepID=A0A2V2YP31_9BACL|nr:hypothetical protein [Paenibacillus cellulosilyticus]PWV97898.1 D-mannose binding lectin [Paenibacillus cellulosilyticus]QKS46932.1 hypothetical protein HUB94_20890 [Paenibacillus cellulosilyticus]
MNKLLSFRSFRIVMACLLLLAFSVPATVSASNLGDRLTIGSSFAKGDYLASQDGRFAAIWQNDGNFVIYQNGSSIWSTSTNNSSAISFKFEPTGKLVMYTYGGSYQYVYQYAYRYGFNPTTLQYEYYWGWDWDYIWVTNYSTQQPLWLTDTASWIPTHHGSGLPANTTGDTLVMQNDGNLVLYNTTLTNTYYPNSWIPVWASNTGGR